MVISVAELEAIDVVISVAELEAIELWETSFLLWQHTSVHYSLVALIIPLIVATEVFIAQWLQLR